MKTHRSYTAILLLLALLFAVALQASTALKTNLLHETPPVNVVNEKAAAALAVEFDFEEEAYVNDIPFSTECVSAQCRYNKAIGVEYEMEEESYVDDIPFNTANISKASRMNDALEIEYDNEDEAFVDDIPFDTYVVAKSYNYNEQFAHNK